MTLLELVIILTGVTFFFFAVDLYQRKRFNLLHFLVFFGWTWALMVFILRPDILEAFGGFFGLDRGADLIVYASIIGLAYFYFELLNKDVKTSLTISKLVTALGIQQTQDDLPAALLKPSAKPEDEYCFLIRAYNEEKTIWNVIDTVVAAGFSKMIIANDWSRDNTCTIVQQKQQQYPHAGIVLINHVINRGGGAANKTLFEFVKRNKDALPISRYVTFDADNQMDIADMKIFMAQASQATTPLAILGSRFVDDGAAQDMPTVRKLILQGSRLVNYLFSGIRATDPPNGYRVLHKEVFTDIAIETDGMGYCTELLLHLKNKNIPYKEIGVHIKYTDYSLAKGQKNSNAFKILRELIYKTLFFK